MYYFWLLWVFVAGLSLSLVAGRGYSICSVWAYCGGFSCCEAWALGHEGSIVVLHGLSCLAACGIFLNRGLNPCPLPWHVDS